MRCVSPISLVQPVQSLETNRTTSPLVPIPWDEGGIYLARKLPIFYSALLLTGVNLLLRLASTSFQVYLSGRIGAAGIGLLQLVLSVASMAMIAGMAGVRTASMYLTAEELGKKRPGAIPHVLTSCMGYSLLCSGMVSLAIYCAAPWLAEHWIGDAQTMPALRLFAAFLPMVCLGGVLTGHYTAADRISTLAAVEVAEQLCSMAVTFLALEFWAGQDLGRACVSVILGSCIGAWVTLLSLALLRKRETPGPRLPIARRLIGIAIPLALADDLKTGLNTLENLMVPKRLQLYPGVGNPLAVFGAVCGMVFPVLMFPAAILFALAELLLPELARCAAAGSQRRIRYLTRRSLRVALLYGLGCGGILFLLAEPLCQRLYHNDMAGIYLRRFALLAPMLYCDAVTDAMTKGLGQQKYCVRYNILTSAMDVALLFVLLPRFGINGYFASFLVTHLLNFILSIRRLLITAKLKLTFFVPTFATAATMLAVWGAMQFSGIAGQILAFFGLFCALSYLFGVLRREDLQWIQGLIHPQA